MSLWLSTAELRSRPTSGPAWDAVKAAAYGGWGAADISDQNSNHNIFTLAGAYVSICKNDTAVRRRTREALAAVVGSEEGGQVLALGRNLAAYCIAADSISYRDQNFVNWVDRVRTEPLINIESGDKQTTSTMINRHETRANNWGACCGMSRVAADLYLGDTADLSKAVTIWKGWLGERTAYSDFFYGAAGKSWCHDEDNPVPVNPKGSMKNGHDIDGVLPADQNRTGPFEWPPPCGNYPHGVLGYVLVTIEMLRRNGYPGCHNWSDAAPKRALEWLERNHCPASGDDAWQPYLAKRIYPLIHLVGANPRSKGKPMAWTAWTHG
jgi:hypothetical protein